nr:MULTISPECIES: Mu transposase C-terminal domain-containing protein [unclassified Staphylococcus]
MEKYKIIEPYLKRHMSVQVISNNKQIPQRTIYSWLKNYDNKGLIGLINRRRKDLDQAKLNADTLNYIKNEYLINKGISIASIHRKTVDWCNKMNYPTPSYKQVYSSIKKVSNHLKSYSDLNSKKYAEKYDAIYLRECNQPNEIWQADHTMLDIEVLNEKNKLERPWLTVVLDDFSRAIAGYRIEFGAPDTIRTALVLRQAIWKKGDSNWPICGIPEKFYTDHGKDYTSEHMQQVSANLKMELIFSKVGIPKGRGKIERFFQTVNLMFLEVLPGYTKNKKSRKHLTLEELNERFEEFLLNNYHYRPHGTTKEPPIEKWNQSNFLPNLPNSRESLDLLLLTTSKPRKIRREGIYFKGLRYFSTTLIAYITEDVFIRYDPNDISEVRVYLNNQFLCIAYCNELENQSVGIKEIERARINNKRTLGKSIVNTKQVVKNMQNEKLSKQNSKSYTKKKSKLKRYKYD